jgi:hypothetical protein
MNRETYLNAKEINKNSDEVGNKFALEKSRAEVEFFVIEKTGRT